MQHSPEQRSNNDTTMLLIGHSTVLINMHGKWIITDPVLFDKSGFMIGSWKIGITRLTKAAITINEIPQLDYVLLSHAHMDHRDYQSLHALTDKFPNKIHFICPRNTAYLLSSIANKREIHEIERGDEQEIEGLFIRGGETNHRGARRPWQKHKYYTHGHPAAMGYNSYLLQYQGHSIVFGGDTAYTEAYQRLAQNIDIAMMPIGAYDPRERYHCTPEQAVQMAEHMNASWFLPIHFETFRLDKAHHKAPIQRLQHALASHSSIQLAVDTIGQQFILPAKTS